MCTLHHRFIYDLTTSSGPLFGYRSTLYRETKKPHRSEYPIDMAMEKMMGCQIPAFGMWNYCNDLSITQYFDSAMQARLMKRWNRRGSDAATVMVADKGVASCREQQLVLFRTPSFQRKPAAQIKVIRREVEKHCDGNELQDGGVQAEAVEYPMKRQVLISKAVDEDLYKVPQPLMYEKPRKMRKVVWSMWIGCLGLACIA